jgi:hypothetical protein
MTDDLEEFKTFLPKYLSTDAQANLFSELKQFPDNINGRLYTSQLVDQPNLFQGDGIASLWVADLPNEKIGKTRVMVLSNSCDISLENKKLLGPRMLYCPIISFTKYQVLARDNLSSGTNLAQHLDEIRKQRGWRQLEFTSEG